MKAGHDNFTRRLFQTCTTHLLVSLNCPKLLVVPFFVFGVSVVFFVFYICILWKTNKTKVLATTIKDKSFVWSSLHSILNNRKEKELLKDNDDVDDYSVSASIERAAWGATCILPSCILPAVCHNFYTCTFLHLHVVLILDVPFLVPMSLISIVKWMLLSTKVFVTEYKIQLIRYSLQVKYYGVAYASYEWK